MISIIIPYYNKSSTILRTLSSILRALKKSKSLDYEVIIVNDGSSTSEIEKLNAHIDKFRDLNIIVLHKTNGGVSSARNFGIKASNHPFIYFLDADDSVTDNFFLNLHSNHLNECSNHVFNLKINSKVIKNNISKNTIFNERNFIELFKKRCLHLSNFMFSAKNISYFNEEISVGEDLLFIYSTTIDKEITSHDLIIGEYNYDGKFHLSTNNGIELILQSIKYDESEKVLKQAINERNYLSSCFSSVKSPYDISLVSNKIKLIGKTKSLFIYSLVQKIRFLFTW
ncbi:MAG: glycosyltransferase family 2 protein [Providencia sp.]|jgi:glycosyltransferase involved in cell wall biosynthesis|nr:glycosyltransferase family 2 protein [Providencia sp.]